CFRARLAAGVTNSRLPSGVIGHTRDYMPKLTTTSKVIDAFVRLDPGADLLIHYPVELSADETEILEGLVAPLGYFGRAESWVDGRLVEEVEPDEQCCRPVIPGPASLPDRGEEQAA